MKDARSKHIMNELAGKGIITSPDAITLEYIEDCIWAVESKQDRKDYIFLAVKTILEQMSKTPDLKLASEARSHIITFTHRDTKEVEREEHPGPASGCERCSSLIYSGEVQQFDQIDVNPTKDESSHSYLTRVFYQPFVAL